jgi:transcriptional regulator with XRE-family HTH domain
MNDADKSPNPVDVHVGKRIRDRRKEVKLSQEKLAEHLGLTFQQVQKYEKGANRVSASKLYEIASALNASVEYFFRGLADTTEPLGGVAEGQRPFVHDFLTTPEGRELTNDFPRIKDEKVRRRMLELVKALAEERTA